MLSSESPGTLFLASPGPLEKFFFSLTFNFSFLFLSENLTTYTGGEQGGLWTLKRRVSNWRSKVRKLFFPPPLLDFRLKLGQVKKHQALEERSRQRNDSLNSELWA